MTLGVVERRLRAIWRVCGGIALAITVVCDIEDGVLVILVVDVAHRREVYRRR